MNSRIDQTLAEQMAGMTAAEKVATLFDYMERRGQSFYDESVTQLQHACQCANQARLHGGSTTQVASALLHDIGHFLLDEHNAESDFLEEDQNHEEVGADYMEPFFPGGGHNADSIACTSETVFVHHRRIILRWLIRGVEKEFSGSGRRHVGRGTGGIRADPALSRCAPAAAVG